MSHWKTKSPVDIQALDDDLTVFSTVDPISKRGKRYYSYLLSTSRGNVLIHAPDNPAFYRMHGEAIDARGGVQHLFLTHDGDDSDETDTVLRRWNAQLYAHRADLKKLGRPGGYEGDHDFADGVSVVHLPGHSAGYSALLRRRPDGGSQLFAGHALIKGPLGWRAARAYSLFDEAHASLRKLKAVAFDDLMPDHAWLDAGAGGVPPIRLDAAARHAAIEEAAEHLKPYKPTLKMKARMAMRALDAPPLGELSAKAD